MSDYNVNENMVAEAKGILEGIRSHQKNAEDKLTNLDRQVEDLKLAQRKLSEAYTKAAPEYTGEDSKLSRYIKKDGNLRTRVERSQISINGQGVIDAERKGLLDDSPICEWQGDLQKIVRQRNFARMLMANPHTPKMDVKLHKHLELAPKSIKPQIERVYAGSAGSGAEWTQSRFVEELAQDYKTPRSLRALLEEVPVDRGSLLIPRLSKGGQPYVQTTISDDNPYAAANQYKASTVTTAQKTINMQGMTVRYLIDQAVMEDSALALTQILSRDLVDTIESGFEDAMINGQTSGAFDSDFANWNPRSRWTVVGNANDHRKAFDGFRQLAANKSTRNMAADPADMAFSDIVTAISSMGEYGASQDKVLVVSPEALIKHFLDLSELVTIDKFGDKATVLTGTQLGSIMGMPILMSRFMTADLDASGNYTSTPSTMTGFCIFNRSSFHQYVRRGLQVETQRDIATGAMTLVASFRGVMASSDSALAKNCAFITNLNS
jgi:hypothetical protein